MKSKKIKASLFNSKSKDSLPLLKQKSILKKESKTIIHKSSKKKDMINRSLSSSAYLKKNIYKIKSGNSKNKMPVKILKENDLNLILYKLKSYYNNLMFFTKKNEKKIQELNGMINVKEKKLEICSDFQNFELPDEKISTKDFNKLHVTRKEIEAKIKDLIIRKQQLNDLLQNEKQYLKSLEYMYENDKNKSLEIKKEINDVEFNLFNTEKNLLILEHNLIGHTNKNMGFNQLVQKLQNNIDIANEVIEHQMDENSKLSKKIQGKEKKTNDLKKFIKQKNEQNSIELELYKDMKISDIKNAYEKERDKREKEKYYIEIITTIYLIQKYFIDSPNFDKKQLETDQDYINLKTNNILVMDNKNNQSNFENKEEENMPNSIIINNNMSNGFSMSKSNSNINDEQKKNELELRDNKILSDIKQKLDSININKERLFDFYSELSSKITFYLKILNNFHEKQITLENKKESLNKKVKKILERDFVYFEELTKSNSRLKNYNASNESFINELKQKKKNHNYEEMNKQMKKNESKKELNSKMKKSERNKDQSINNSIVLYSKIDNLTLTNKNFASIAIDILNNIISYVSKSVKLNNLNKDFINSTFVKKKEVVEPKSQRELKPNKFDEFTTESIDIKNNDYKSLNMPKEEINQFIRELFYIFNNMSKSEEISKEYSNDKDNTSNMSFYIEQLCKYYEENDYLRQELYLEIDKMKDILINDNFDKDEKNIINKLFNESLIKYNISNKYSIFNYFSNFSSQIIDNIKLIVDFLNDYENNSVIFQELEKNSNNSTNDNIQEKTVFKKIKALRDDKNLKKKEKLKINGSQNNTSDFHSIKSGEYENSDSSMDTEINVEEKKKITKKLYSTGTKITNRLYTPFLEKTFFIRKLNKNMNDIKAETLKDSRTNFALAKKMREEKIISSQMLIYNNPNININNLSLPIYKELNSLIIRAKKIKETQKKQRRLQSCSSFKKKLLKNIYK